MRIDPYRKKELISKLIDKNQKERAKIIYGWVKQGHINFKEFEYLVDCTLHSSLTANSI